MNGSRLSAVTSGDVLEPDTPESLGILDLDGDRDDRLGLGPAPPTAALHSADVPLVNLDVTLPAACGADGPSPRDSGGASPRRSDRSRARAIAEPPVPRRRAFDLSSATRPRTTAEAGYGCDERSCPRSPTPGARIQRTPSTRRQGATRPAPRSEDSALRPASAATQGSRGTRTRQETTTAAPRTSLDSLGRPPAPPQAT